MKDKNMVNYKTPVLFATADGLFLRSVEEHEEAFNTAQKGFFDFSLKMGFQSDEPSFRCEMCDLAVLMDEVTGDINFTVLSDVPEEQQKFQVVSIAPVPPSVPDDVEETHDLSKQEVRTRNISVISNDGGTYTVSMTNIESVNKVDVPDTEPLLEDRPSTDESQESGIGSSSSGNTPPHGKSGEKKKLKKTVSFDLKYEEIPRGIEYELIMEYEEAQLEAAQRSPSPEELLGPSPAGKRSISRVKPKVATSQLPRPRQQLPLSPQRLRSPAKFRPRNKDEAGKFPHRKDDPKGTPRKEQFLSTPRKHVNTDSPSHGGPPRPKPGLSGHGPFTLTKKRVNNNNNQKEKLELESFSVLGGSFGVLR